MNSGNLDFEKTLKDVIDATVEVYGEEYRNIIENRAKKIVYFPYTTGFDISYYVNSLINVKSKDLSLKFLTKTGLLKNNEDKQELILKYLGFNQFNVSWYIDNSGIKSFLANLEIDEYVLKKQVEFLNYLRNNEEPLITLENYQQYKTTDEYFKQYKKIQELLIVYKELEQEMNEFYDSFNEYKEFIKNEEKIEKGIHSKKLVKLYYDIERFLPQKVKDFLNLKNLTELQKANMLLDDEIAFRMDIEFFSKEYEDKLRDPEVESSTKRLIINSRLNYLSIFGVEKPNSCTQEKYYEIIQNEDIKQLIPNAEDAELITQIRESLYEEAKKEIIYSNKYFIENTKYTNSDFMKNFYQLMKNKQTCIVATRTNMGDINPGMVLNIGGHSLGKLDYFYLHEFVHAIEISYINFYNSICGYDKAFLFGEMNPYDNKKRKYERMNETFTDIIALEIQKKLQDKQIYMFESKEYLYEALDECNTSKILKNIL